MKILIGRETVSLSDRTLIGQGGEAEVHRHLDKAIKIFRGLAADVVQQKLAKLAAFPTRLPATVLSPIEIVTETGRKRTPLGYTMAFLDGVEDLKRLSQRRFRDGVIPNARVMKIFQALHTLLTLVHDAGVVVGDLNDANVVFAHDEPFLIDVDSLQFGAHLCLVAHERFLDPRLFGQDLAAQPAFTPLTDWYAFSVMLFQSLLYVHPYGGVHRDHATLTRRAEARHSVLKGDVALPRAAVHPRVLPDELLAWFEATFDRDLRDTFPLRLLDVRWVRCTACGLEHARRACPDCASRGAVVMSPPVVHAGRCRVVPILRTRGRVLAAIVQGNLKYVIEEDGVCRRESGERVLTQPLEAGMRFAISGPSTAVGFGGRVVLVRSERPFAKHRTATFGGAPMFAATASRTLVIEDDWLIDASFGTRLGSVLGGQTWLAAGETLGYGFYRAGAVSMHFLFDPRRPGLTDLPLPPIAGRLVDVDAVFDEERALIGIHTEKDGRAEASLYLVERGGRVLGTHRGAPESSPLLASVRGKALFAGRALAATDPAPAHPGGLATIEVVSGQLAMGRLFTETAPFVSASASILPGPSGSVYVATTKEITQLCLS